MRILVYEFFCGGGCAGQPAQQRWTGEGWAMLSAVVEDFAAIPSVDVISSLDARLAGRRLATDRVEIVKDSKGEHRLFTELGRQCDAVVIIAPELDGALHQRCRWVEAGGGRLLGPTVKAVALCSDKFTLNRLLEQRDVAVPDACLLTDPQQLPANFPYPAVRKPRFGAGSEGIVAIADPDSAPPNPGGAATATILERLIPGRAVSASFLVGPHAVVPLAAGTQRLSQDGRFSYLGGRLPLLGAEAIAAVDAAGRAVAAVPGLRGFVGVDLVISDALSGSQLPQATVIEINPRLTSSYTGLRALARGNVAAWMLEVFEERNPRIEWTPGSVEFDADGTIRAATQTS